jgi:hypothetical protein
VTDRPLDERVVAAAERVAGGLRPPTAASPELTIALERLEEIAGIARAFAATPASGDGPRPEPLFLWGPFEIRERLGEGSFGEVYRAWEPGLDREVALKLRRGESAAPHALLAEARRLALVRHPNVVVVHGAGIHGGRVGLWTDLVEGETLEERLEREGRLSATETVAIGLDLCRALAAIHGAGLVHGDLKASNVLRERGGRIVIADFGSASAHGPGERESLVPRTGTPAALAPEVLAGAAPSAASDIYAVGTLLFRLLTGVYPKRTLRWREAQEGGLENRLLDLRPELQRPLVELVERALDPRPAVRFASAGDLASALAATLEGGARRRWRDALAAAALVAALVALIVGLVTSGRRPAAPPPVVALETQLPGQSEPPSPAPPRIEATLLRRRGAEIARLQGGATVKPGDRLQLELESSEPLHVYVLNEDEHGELYLLFPLAGLDRRNPIVPMPAGRSTILPGSLLGAQQDWQVTSAGGVERFLIVASRGPNPELEARLGVLEPAAPGRALRLDPLAREAVRGVGGLEPAPASPHGPPESESALDRLEQLLAGRRELRLIRLELVNPS